MSFERPLQWYHSHADLAGRYLDVGGSGGFKRGGGGTQHAVLVQHLFQSVFSQGRQESKHVNKNRNKNRIFHKLWYRVTLPENI
jgi:hypothetical protein